jgi:hypothetical protein
MFHWLRQLFGRKTYRVAKPWETPPEIRKKMRCAGAGIDPASIQESSAPAAKLIPERQVLETGPQGRR